MIKTDACNYMLEYAYLLYIHNLFFFNVHVLLSAMQGCILDCSSYLAPCSRYDLYGYASLAITSIISFRPHRQVNNQPQV